MEHPLKSELVVELLKQSFVQGFGHALEDVVERCVSPLRTRAQITRADFSEVEQSILAEAQERRRARSAQGFRSPKLKFLGDASSESGAVKTADWNQKPRTPRPATHLDVQQMHSRYSTAMAPAQSVNGRSTPFGKLSSGTMDFRNDQPSTPRREAKSRLVSGAVKVGSLQPSVMTPRSSTPRLDAKEKRIVGVDTGTILHKSPDLNSSDQVRWPLKQAFGPVTNSDHRQNDVENEGTPFINVLIKRSQFDVMNRMKPANCRMLTPRGKFTRSNLHWQKQNCSLREGWG